MKSREAHSDSRAGTPGQRYQLTMREAFILAVVGGLVVSVAEVGTLATARWIAPRIMRTGDSFVWIVPVYYLLVFSGLGGILALATRILSRESAIRLAAGSVVSLAAFSILLLAFYGRINQWALALLALGMGVQAGRWVGQHSTVILRRLGPVMLMLALPVFLLGVGVPLFREWEEASWNRRGDPERVGAPNVLLIILDTVRAASLSLYGNPRPTTPNLLRLAERSVVFDRAYATSSWTLPSHATIFTGRYSHEVSADWLRPLDDEYPTLAEVFRDAGYRTGGFVANMTYASRETGLDRGFSHYEDYPVSRLHLQRATALNYFFNTWRRPVKPSRRSVAFKPASSVSGSFLQWIDAADPRPFFGFLNYFEAHQRYRFDPSFRNRFKTGNRVEERYEAAIATLDLELSRLRDSLERRGILDNTIVVITSDHGELLGEFNLKGHANSLYSPLLHVPLVISYPTGIPDPARIVEPVTLRDLPATITRLAGLTHRFPGSSLTRFWDSTEVETGFSPLLARISKGIRTPPEEPVSLGDMESIVQGQHQLIVNGDGKLEMYDLNTNPASATNLLLSSQYHGLAAELTAALRAATGADVSTQRERLKPKGRRRLLVRTP